LRDQLSKLRTSLPDPTLLNANPQTVSLDFERVSVDYLDFQRLQKQIGRVTWTLSLSATMPIAAYNTMVAMAEMRNEPGFISGVDIFESYEADEWLTITRQRLDNEYLAIIQRLFHHERAAGNSQRAIHWLHKALQIDPRNEEVNLLLLNTFLENGQQAEARKQFAYFQKVMGQDIEANLSEELEALKEKIFSELQAFSPLEEHPWPVRSTLNVPFVGQEKILAQSVELYNRGGAVIVYGETGAGKTRLAQEVHNHLQPHPRLLLASCYSDKLDVPFYPWIELLRTLMTRDEWLRIPVEWANTLLTLFPELATLRQGLEPVSAVNSARTREKLFEIGYQVLQFLSQGGPVMLLLDDAHWADESSCEYLSYLLDRAFFRSPNRILMMTARIEEPNPGLTKILNTIPSRVLEQKYLARLTKPEVADLAEYVFESTPSQEFVRTMTRNSGGNPFFILETFQAILDSPEKYSLQDPTSLPVSSSVNQLILARLERLSTDAHEVLQIAAILGSQFDVDVLEKASAFPTDRFIFLIETLEEERLIARMQESKKLRYAFVHENIRDSLLQGMPALRSKQVHYKVACALEEAAQGKTDEIAITLAQHYEDAEKFSLAFAYWIQGAVHAYQITSIKEALNAFAHAKKLVDVAGNLDDQQLYELYTKWTEVIIYLDDPLELEKLSREMLDFGRERDSDLLIGAGLDGLSDACFANNQYKQGLEYVIEAAPYVQRSGNLYEILIVQAHQAVFLYMLGKFQEARPKLYEVLERIPAEQDTRLRNLYCNLHYQIGIVEVLMGYPNKGLEFLKRALEHRHQAPAPLEVMSIYTAMGLAYFLQGEFKPGRMVCATAIEMGEQLKYHRMLGYAYSYSALNSLYLGLMNEAWEFADRALYFGQTYGHPEISALAYRCMGGVYLRLEDYQSAIEYFQQGLKAAGKHFVAFELMPLMGYAMFSIGKNEEGLEHLINAYQLSSQSQLGSISIYAHSLLLLVRCLQEDLDSGLVEDIELALVDATRRSIKRAVIILKTPMTSISQRPADILKQFDENMQEALQMSDPIFEIGLLLRLVKFKKNENMTYKSELERMDSILKELAPRTEGMPFESAWQQYFKKMKETHET